MEPLSKRPGRPSKDAPLTGAERARKHRAQKREAAVKALEGAPEYKIDLLQQALDSANVRNRELRETNEMLNRRLCEAAQDRDSLRFHRDRLIEDVELLRQSMKDLLTDERVEHLFVDLLDRRD